MMTMTDEARKAKNAYYRNYYAKNKERIRANQAAYWERKTALPPTADASQEPEPIPAE
jgi:hypothetical protein